MSYRYVIRPYRPRRRTGPDLGAVGIIMLGCLVVLVLVGLVAFSFIGAHHIRHRTCTVVSKDRTSDGHGSDARLYTKECGVLSVEDSTWQGNFHSADTYASIHAGHRYAFTTQGWRIPFLSQFPNVLEAHDD